MLYYLYYILYSIHILYINAMYSIVYIYTLYHTMHRVRHIATAVVTAAKLTAVTTAQTAACQQGEQLLSCTKTLTRQCSCYAKGNTASMGWRGLGEPQPLERGWSVKVLLQSMFGSRCRKEGSNYTDSTAV